MAKYLHISIPTPCHENWDSMTAADKGRFCNSCQKTVIDFSAMTDEQLIDFFKKSKQDVCGRFDDQQLQRHIPVPPKRIPWLTYFFKITIPAFLFTAKAAAQEVVKSRVAIVAPCIGYPLPPIGILKIPGTVIDSSSNPIPNASIVIANTNSGVSADENGRFEITLKADERVLNVSRIGYKPVQYAVNHTEGITIVLKEESKTLGDVTITSDYASRRMGGLRTCYVTYIRMNKNFVSEDSISIFPNPVQRNSIMNIRWKKHVSSDQAVEVYNFGGALMQKEILQIRNKTKEASFRINTNSSGVYVVRITDMKSGSVEAKQVVVE